MEIRRLLIVAAFTLAWSLGAMELLGVRAAPLAAAETPAVEYRQMIEACPELMTYWPLTADLSAAKGEVAGTAVGGEPQFSDGIGEARALTLADGRYVNMGATPELDLDETTVELWFRPDYAAGRANPCLIAKRADDDHRNTRFSIHLWSDYSCVAIWDGHQVRKYTPPTGKLQRGQWYHLAVTHDARRTNLYLDGVGCLPENLPERIALEKTKLPLLIGVADTKGKEPFTGQIAHVAFYRKALAEVDLASHVDTMGFKSQRLAAQTELDALRAKLQREREQREAKRREQLAAMAADPALTARGEPFVYRGAHLSAIELPLGGIGTGVVQINGKCQRKIWQIFNNHLGVFVPDSFFAIRTVSGDQPPVLRALQTEAVGPFAAMHELSFRGAYPFGWYDFEDDALPVKVTLEAFNPLVPLDAKNSSIPCAIFSISVQNPGKTSVEVSLLATQQNAVGYRAKTPIAGRSHVDFGGNRNTIRQDPGCTMLHMTSDRPSSDVASADMVLAAMVPGTTAPQPSGSASWDNVDQLAEQFMAKSRLSQPASAGPSPQGETLNGALCIPFTLKPGEKRQVTFVLAWCFPNGGHGSGEWVGRGNMYANWWPDARGVARYVCDNYDDLHRKSRLYYESFYASNLPYWLLDRLGSQVAVLRSQTCFWAKDGYFGGWEGCCRSSGCCHGNCNHVWHYAQAHARLFPSIARQMREQEFRFQSPDGSVPFRQPKHQAAFDGQCGTVLNSYREHLMSNDRAWLDENWPKIRLAMDYITQRWDPDGDGVLHGAQWNTLDGALGGSSSWLGSLYLAALAAAEEMALLENDPSLAQRYSAIRRSGIARQDATLFNGEYYIQIPEQTPHEDYGAGCHIDQVLGQWWAHQLDLGWIYPPEHVESALSALLKYNFHANYEGIHQSPRKFVADFDPGLQMITWPKDRRPPKVIRYGDEVMTGFEYSAAAAMVQSGMLREGLLVVKAIATRYDGRLRTHLTASDYASWGYSGNPFGDDECGKFYARAMSVWSMLLACQGFVYDGPAKLIGFDPVWQPEDHQSFFTSAEGWGRFSQRREGKRQTEKMVLDFGRLPVGTLRFAVVPGSKVAAIAVRRGESVLDAKYSLAGHQIQITLPEGVCLDAGDALDITLSIE